MVGELKLEKLVDGKWIRDDSAVSLLDNIPEEDILDYVVWSLKDGYEILIKGTKIRLADYEQQKRE